MQVKINESFQVDAPIEDVWAMLSDPARVVTCVPGAQITETIDERNYKGTVSMKIGPVVTDFKGDIHIEEMDEAAHALVLLGNGMDAKGKGSAKMKLVGNLQSLDDGGTEVTTSMEVSVIGRLAQFGARLMEDVSKRVFQQFVECFKSNLQPVDEAPVEEAAADVADDDAASPPTTSAAPSAATVAAPSKPATATASPPRPAPTQAPEPVKALPLLFQAIGAAIRRFFRRLVGRSKVS